MFVLFVETRMFPMLVGEFYVLFKLYGDDTVGCMLWKSHMICLRKLTDIRSRRIADNLSAVIKHILVVLCD